MLKITREQADAAYTILCQHAGAYDDARGLDRDSFVYWIAHPSQPTDEYRFQGALGFGGKFRNNGSRPTPYVDCYPEEETLRRSAMIQATNKALVELFAGAQS